MWIWMKETLQENFAQITQYIATKLAWLGFLQMAYLGIVVFPDSASNLMTSQIKCFELNFPNTQLL